MALLSPNPLRRPLRNSAESEISRQHALSKERVFFRKKWVKDYVISDDNKVKYSMQCTIFNVVYCLFNDLKYHFCTLPVFIVLYLGCNNFESN